MASSCRPVDRYHIGGVAPTDHQRLQALCLDTGGVASHRSAAWLHGLDGFGPAPFEVTVTRPLPAVGSGRVGYTAPPTCLSTTG